MLNGRRLETLTDTSAAPYDARVFRPAAYLLNAIGRGFNRPAAPATDARRDPGQPPVGNVRIAPRRMETP